MGNASTEELYHCIYLYLFAEKDYDVHIFDRRPRDLTSVLSERLQYAGELDARSSGALVPCVRPVCMRCSEEVYSVCTVWPAGRGSSPPPAAAWLDREQRPNQTPSSSPACPTSRPAAEPRPPRSPGNRAGLRATHRSACTTEAGS